jgi:glycosyltransferase involved in cell wall biosynthesis
MPKVSVVIPTYNRARFLRAAVRTVLDQTFQDFEIVIVDDASSDDTPAVVASLGDGRIKYIRHEQNRRIAGARNTGVSSSAGEYIAFLDDDDEWRPRKLEQQVQILDISAPTVGAVYTAFAQVDVASGNVVGVITPVKRGHILHELGSRNWVGTASTVCVRRQCFEEVGLFDESVAFGEEYDMWIRIAHRFDFRYIDEVLVGYGLHARRLSRNYDVMISGLTRQLEKYDAFFGSDPANHSRRFMSLGRLYCYSGDARRGREAFWEAIKLWPFAPKHYLYFGLALLGARGFTTVRGPSGLQ